VEPTATPVATRPPVQPTPTQAPPPPTPVPVQQGSADILAIGDSVMIGAVSQMSRLGTVEVDAQEGRQATEDVTLLQARRAAGTLPPVIVIQTGNNGPIRQSQLEAMLAAVSGHRVVLVTLQVDRDWEAGNNAMLAAAAGGNVTVATGTRRVKGTRSTSGTGSTCGRKARRRM
jgi:hypothetical protein